MKLISFSHKGIEGVGLIAGDGVVDLSKRLASHPAGLRVLLASEGLKSVAGLASTAPDYPLSAVTLLPVIPNPDKVLCVGMNYKAHIPETGRPQPAFPMMFVRFAGSQVGSGQAMIRPHVSAEFDYEGELAVIIGKAGRYIPRDKALQHVAGYSCFNDGSVRDYQNQTMQFTAGKNFSKSGAFGPWLVTPDESGAWGDMILETRLNGQAVQRSPVSDLLFDVPALIEYCSIFAELLPGDVIATGTPGGVGMARKPPLWMKPGDVVEVEISKIGVLKNTIEDEPAGK